MNKKFLFIIIIVLQIFFLFSMGYSKSLIIKNGFPIYLKVLPVDPRDLFRGDYVILDYEISYLKQSLFAENVINSLDLKKSVYVSLEETKDGWDASLVSVLRPDEGVFLKGYIKSNYFANNVTRVDYGLDSFYVPEGMGRGYEDLAKTGDLYAEVFVNKNGYSIVTRLLSREQFLAIF